MRVQIITGIIAMSLFCFSCEREPVDRRKYVDPEEIGTNYIELQDNAYMLEKGDKEKITEVTPDKIIAQGGMFTDLESGDVIINTAIDPGDTLAYFRKVESVEISGDMVTIQTRDATLPEAYKRYYIDSRANVTELKTRSFFSQIFSINRSSGFLGVTLAAVINPTLEFDIAYDTTASYFISSYDENNAIFGPARFELRIRSLTLNVSASMEVTGKLEGKVESDFPAIPIAPIGVSGLTIYLLPKMELAASIEGTIATPTLIKQFGGMDIDFVFDDAMGGVVENSYNYSVPTPINNTSEWMVNGSGGAEYKGGAEILIAVTGTADFAKCGIFLFHYITPTASKKGDFDDLNPRVEFTAEQGFGAQFFAEFNFFGGELPPVDWIPDQFKLESPDDRIRTDVWNLGDFTLCDKFSNVDFEYLDGGLLLNVQSASPDALFYSIQVNDEPYNGGQFYQYGESVDINISNLTQLVNTIEVIDLNGNGCSLGDTFVDPSLVTDCDNFITDPRDSNKYCTTMIGDLEVFTENLRFKGDNFGKAYNNVENDELLIFGRLYTFEELLIGHDYLSDGDLNVRGLCPQGWHVPSAAEWAFILNTLGRADFGKKAKFPSPVLWSTSELPESSQINAVPAGEYYSWRPPGSQFGKKGKKTTFWSATYDSVDKAVRVIEIDETNNGGLASQSGAGEFIEQKSIKDIGYSCRCVRNI